MTMSDAAHTLTRAQATPARSNIGPVAATIRDSDLIHRAERDQL